MKRALAMSRLKLNSTEEQSVERALQMHVIALDCIYGKFALRVLFYTPQIPYLTELGRHISPLIVSAMKHTSTQHLSKHEDFTHFSFPPSLPPPRIGPTAARTFPAVPLSQMFWWSEARGPHRTLVTDGNALYRWDATARCLRSQTQTQTRTNVLNPTVECDRMFKKPSFSDREEEEDKSRDTRYLQRCCHATARILRTNTKGLVKVARTLTGLKHALVFQLLLATWQTV